MIRKFLCVLLAGAAAVAPVASRAENAPDEPTVTVQVSIPVPVKNLTSLCRGWTEVKTRHAEAFKKASRRGRVTMDDRTRYELFEASSTTILDADMAMLCVSVLSGDMKLEPAPAAAPSGHI